MKYIVFSKSINAWTIKYGLKKINKHLEVYNINEKRGILKSTIDFLPKDSTLFFTEENYLKKYIGLDGYRSYPKKIPLEILDDKYNFAHFLIEIRESPIPYTDHTSKIDFPFYLKAKHSWKNDKKLPRGYICNNQRELDKSLAKISDLGMQREWFFKQKLLTSPVENNISTSGFYDYKNNKRNIIIVTKKTLGTGEKITDGSVVETIRDPNNLIDRTKYILNKLKYQGPFELEFFYELRDNQYYVLELNPRFWLQHGIFIEHYDNAVIKRYLDLDTPSDWLSNGIPEFKKIIWINNLYYNRSLLLGNYNFISNVKKMEGNKVFYPNSFGVFQYYKNTLLNRIYR